MNPLKTEVRQFWERIPCGAADANQAEEGSLAFFEEVEKQRYTGDDFMAEVAGFDRWQGKKILEVGCGLGADLRQFARGGAEVYAIDLTEKAAGLARKRLGLYGFKGNISISDSETLPFKSDSFDLVYSWGVIHHTPDTAAAAKEILRVCKPGGQVMVMLYHRRSILAFQAWLFYGLLRGRPFESPSKVISERVESPGTKVYTPKEGRELFPGLKSITVKRIVTRYDLRIGRRLFLPHWFRKIVPSRFGWFMVLEGQKI
ncbi:MAG TPA: hypothetical protein DC047_02325 [Blastocatellia bacterium]|nr:hypothetical protein [Blastocatellia bacterium]